MPVNPRVSGSDVKEILDTELTASELTPFIETAHLLINKTVTEASDALGVDVGSELLTRIELWLSAHFASIRDKRVTVEKVGPAEFRYEGQSGTRLDGTRYGQQAISIDPTGALSQMGQTRSSLDFRASQK